MRGELACARVKESRSGDDNGSADDAYGEYDARTSITQARHGAQSGSSNSLRLHSRMPPGNRRRLGSTYIVPRSRGTRQAANWDENCLQEFLDGTRREPGPLINKSLQRIVNYVLVAQEAFFSRVACAGRKGAYG